MIIINFSNAGAKNEFVRVTIDLMTNNLKCTFLNSGDQSTKNCNVMYWQCKDRSTCTIKNASAERPFDALQPSVVLVELSLEPSSQSLFYNVSASNDTFAVNVHGNTTIESKIF